MTESEVQILIQKIANTRSMVWNEQRDFQQALMAQSDLLGENIINFLWPLWSTWPSFAEDVVADI